MALHAVPNRVQSAADRIELLFRLFDALLPLPGHNIALHLVDDEHCEYALRLWATNQRLNARERTEKDEFRSFTIYRNDGSELATVIEDLTP
jgi:hypothetical protein